MMKDTYFYIDYKGIFIAKIKSYASAHRFAISNMHQTFFYPFSNHIHKFLMTFFVLIITNL